ncbi:hypothetical protein NDU88_000928 [Pleurodeles waltl]|uniref:Uncharacterized protein n=1 Tax=Pleurodeles waltl TaxID=8319 RepID=A0AAV7U8M9_PLEWA|nr:hypothetical protein NDU88_000928 [Pleurodeles waltl]
MFVQLRGSPVQAIKRNPRAAGLTNALLFSAKLRILHDKRFIFFDSLEAALEWLDQNFPNLDKPGHMAQDLPRPQRKHCRHHPATSPGITRVRALFAAGTVGLPGGTQISFPTPN